MADVFVSYCSADRSRVGELAQALEKEGLSVWWDRALIAGSSYESEIDGALKQAKAVVVVWTPASAASDWVRSESDGARVEGKLVPVILESARVPRPFDRLHTIDMSQWRGDRGNQGFPETLEAVKALVEGRAAKPVPWRRRITLAAMGSALVIAVIFIAALVQIGAAARFFAPAAFAADGAHRLSAERSSPATQEGFENALKALATSFDLRTQNALHALNQGPHGDRTQALQALQTLALDQSHAIDTQMQNAGSLWRQLGLLQFETDPVPARQALEKADRYLPGDATVLTALSVLYGREGRIADAESVSRRALAIGGLSPSDEGGVQQVIAEALLDQGKIDEAKQRLNDALQLSYSTNDEHLETGVHIDLANAAFAEGNTAGALQQFDEAASLADGIDYPEGVARANYNAALVLTASGNLDGAEAKLRSVDAGADAYLKLYVDLATAELSARRGDAQRALDMAENVRRTADGLQFQPIVALALTRESVYLTVLGHAAEGQQAAHDAGVTYQALHDASSFAIASTAEAFAHSRQPNGAAAGCAALQAVNAPAGYATIEIGHIKSLAHCS